MKEEYFIYVGRLDKQKGLDILLKAWNLMGTEAPKLIICGMGPMESWCNNFIKLNDLSSVEMRGLVPNTEVIRLITNSKALILPSQCYEGFPMTIVEAYSVGTPVIGSNMGNVGGLIEDGVTGYKFNVSKSEELAYLISQFVQKSFDKKQIVCFYDIYYLPESNYKTLMDIYGKVVL